MRSMCSTVLFSLTESRTSFHAPPCSLKTSFCGSVNRIAVFCQLMFIILSFSIVVCCVWAVPCLFVHNRPLRDPCFLEGLPHREKLRGWLRPALSTAGCKHFSWSSISYRVALMPSGTSSQEIAMLSWERDFLVEPAAAPGVRHAIAVWIT